VKKFMEYEVKGPRPRGRPKMTWREIMEMDCQARKLKRRMRWIMVNGGRMSDEQDGCEWVNVSSGTGSPG